MSLLSHVHVGPNDTENHVRTKQFNASETQPSVKKKALADVKNTCHQRSAQQDKKPSVNLVKQSNYGGRKLFSSEHELSIKKTMPKKEKNLIGPVKSEILTKNMINKSNHDFVKTCKCDEMADDCDLDMLFEDLKLTTSQIEAYALIWENPPIVSAKDKRPLCPVDKIETNGLDFGYDAYEFLIETIPEIKTPQLEAPVPPLFLEEEMFMTGIDSGIGL